MATPLPPAQVVPPAVADDGTEPPANVIVMGGLQLTEAQASRLLQRALDRLDEVSEEMGISEGQVVGGGWAEKRELNQRQYDNDWEYRVGLKGIFKYSNFSLNISKRYARLMAAKTSDTLLGTKPFFSAMPTEQGNPELAKQAEWYIQEKVDQSNLQRRTKEAQKTALIRNEAVVKLSWDTTETHFRGPAVVAAGPFLLETTDGQEIPFSAGVPVMTPKGNYIYEEDDYFEDPTVEGMFRLEKEPSVGFRYLPKYQYFGDLDQKLDGYTGLDVRTLDYRDFICPLKAQTIHEADINAHLFTVQWERLKARYKNIPIAEKYFQETTPPVNETPISGQDQPKEQKGEMEDGSRVLRMMNCADVFIRCNPFEGDPEDLGMQSEIWMVVDRKNQKIVWADYMGNHMAKRPFEVIVGVEGVSNRWYGVGVFEMLSHKQDFIDTQFNRVNFKSSKSSNVVFRMKNAVEQWKANQKMVVGDDKILDVVDPRFDSRNPPLFAVNLHEISPEAMQLIELMIQAGSTEVGIVGPDDGALAGLDSTKLATGIKSLERTGNVLMKFTEADHAEGIAAMLDQAVNIILEHMDEEEVAFKADSQELFKLNRDEIRRMKGKIKLLLTKSRSTETVETARMVIQLVREYYEALNVFERFKLRREYVRQLKALECPDANELLDEETPESVQAWQEAQAKAADLPPKTSIATKFGDLERSEQEQVLRREGIEPAQFEEVIAARIAEENAEIKKEGAIARAKESAKPKPKTPPKK